eukprot:XP_001704045.1 Hypothetical protein GL50803_2842 [Giardia lamblia ATCC 50803]
MISTQSLILARSSCALALFAVFCSKASGRSDRRKPQASLYLIILSGAFPVEPFSAPTNFYVIRTGPGSFLMLSNNVLSSKYSYQREQKSTVFIDSKLQRGYGN